MYLNPLWPNAADLCNLYEKEHWQSIRDAQWSLNIPYSFYVFNVFWWKLLTACRGALFSAIIELLNYLFYGCNLVSAGQHKCCLWSGTEGDGTTVLLALHLKQEGWLSTILNIIWNLKHTKHIWKMELFKDVVVVDILRHRGTEI